MYIMKLHNVTRAFGGLRAVDEVSIEFSSGGITGLIGPNGAGKTTLFNLISGLLKLDCGEIYFDNIRVDGLTPWEIAKLGIGRLFQDVRVFKKLSVLDNVLLAKLQHPGESPLSVLFSTRRVTNAEKENLGEAHKWVKFVGLSGKENSPAESLSFGQQKLLAIARLLAGGYKLLLLDEPSAGVNPAMIKSLLELMKKIADAGRTIIFIEHNMTVVLEIANWVFFLNEGRVISFGRPDDVLGNDEVRKAYLGV